MSARVLFSMTLWQGGAPGQARGHGRQGVRVCEGEGQAQCKLSERNGELKENVACVSFSSAKLLNLSIR